MDQVRYLQKKEAENINRLKNKVRNELMQEDRRQDYTEKISQKYERVKKFKLDRTINLEA